MSRLSLIRYGGLAGATLLAVAAYLGGALPALESGVTPVSIVTGPHGVLIVGCWLVGTAALAALWWWGREALPSTRWAAVTAGLWCLPLLVAPPLGSRDVYAYACQGASYAGGIDPYQHGVSTLPCPWLETISPVWLDTPAPYGALFVALAGAAVAVTDSLWGSIALLRLLAVAGVVLTAACLPTLARRCGVPARQAIWVGLAAPVIGVHLVSGAHNDAVMIGFMVAGLAAVAALPPRPGPLVAAGVLIGLAVAVKVTAGVVLPFAALAAAGGVLHWGRLIRAGAWLAAGVAGAVLAVSYAAGLGWGWIGGLSSSGATVQWTSPSTAVGQTVEYLGRIFGLSIDAVGATRALGVVALLVVLPVLWWRTARAAESSAWLRGAGFALLATVAFAPVFHPWYLTWPLVVLAASLAGPPRWLLGLTVATSFLVLPDGTNLARFSKFPGAPLMTLAVLALAVYGIRRWRAERREAVGVPSA